MLTISVTFVTGFALKLVTKWYQFFCKHRDELFSILPSAHIGIYFVEEIFSTDSEIFKTAFFGVVCTAVTVVSVPPGTFFMIVTRIDWSGIRSTRVDSDGSSGCHRWFVSWFHGWFSGWFVSWGRIVRAMGDLTVIVIHVLIVILVILVLGSLVLVILLVILVLVVLLIILVVVTLLVVLVLVVLLIMLVLIILLVVGLILVILLRALILVVLSILLSRLTVAVLTV